MLHVSLPSCINYNVSQVLWNEFSHEYRSLSEDRALLSLVFLNIFFRLKLHRELRMATDEVIMMELDMIEQITRDVDNASEVGMNEESETMIRRLTLFFVPISFAVILILGLIGNILVITVVS